MKLKLALATAALALTTPAFAADLPVYQEPAAPIYGHSWTGLYLGANLGWADYKSTWTDVDGDWSDEGTSEQFNSDGFSAGLQLGYNYHTSSNIVLGIEASLHYSDAGQTVIGPVLTGGDLEVTLEDEMKWYGTLRGRLGFALDNFLPYLTGGLAFADFKHQWTELGDPSDSWPDFGGTETGWALGGGFEYAFDPNWSMKLEALYMDFGDVTSTNQDVYRMNVDRTVTSLTFGVNYKF